MTQHLTDAVLSDLLAGEQPDAATQAHLELCSPCRAEWEDLQASVAEFKDLSAAWASQAAPRRVPVPPRWAAFLRPSWSTGLAVTLLTGVLSFHFGPVLHFSAPAHLPEAVPQAAANVANVAPSKAELADDNQLMLSIDQELGYNAGATVGTPAVQRDAREASQGNSPVMN